MLTVVSPFYNEESIIKTSLGLLISNIDAVGTDWELIIVNDGSTDRSLSIAKSVAEGYSNVKIISRDLNMGRGYSLFQGIEAARGDIIITTEIDGSWGQHVIADLYNEIISDPTIDVVIASTNLVGGGYHNVPRHRVLISKLGNKALKFMVNDNISMYTGMTRAYRSTTIQNIPISENGKEFHLDVLIKALAFQCKIREIPATISWSLARSERSDGATRLSSSNIPNLVKSHLMYCLIGQPFKYMMPLGVISFFLSVFTLGWGLLRFFKSEVSIFLLNISIVFFLISIFFAGFSIFALTQSQLLREVWLARREIQKYVEK